MSVLSKTFLTLVSRHLMTFSFFSAWHDPNNFRLDNYFEEWSFTSPINDFEALNEGMLCSGMIIVVFFDIFLAVFCARFFTIKLPNPRR